jgi:hypothetical protein
MDHTTIDTIEVNGSDVDVRITWAVCECECTSDYGDTEVTERWVEATPLLAEQVVTLLNDRAEVVQNVYEFGEETISYFDEAVVMAVENEVITY